MKYRIKRLFNIKNSYLLGMILMVAFVCVTTFSYALFTASTERRGAFNIVSGNLYSLITSKSFNKEKQVTLSPKTSSIFEVKLTNVNGVDAKFNFYYTTTHDNIEIGYLKDEDIPPTEAGIVLKQNGLSGDSKTYLIKITNKDEAEPVTVTFGSDVGLSNKSLAFPADKRTLNEITEENISGIPISKDSYDKSLDEEKHNMFTFIHKNNTTEEITLDYRFIGNDPYNYLKFANDTTDTMYRIIGVFDYQNPKIKIIKDESIGEYEWNSNGTNNWSEASTLNTLLNEKDYFQSLPDVVKTKLEDTTWYLEGLDNNTYNTEDIYNKEREIKDPNTSFTSKIGLLYLSDYGYTFAGDENKTCFNNLFDINSCKDYKENSWLHLDNTNEWTINKNSLNDKDAYYISSNGNVLSSDVHNSIYKVRPVMYLSSNINITIGKGTKEEPYIIS